MSRGCSLSKVAGCEVGGPGFDSETCLSLSIYLVGEIKIKCKLESTYFSILRLRLKTFVGNSTSCNVFDIYSCR
jgi:hypothetical protein